MVTESDLEREREEAREKYRRDMNARLREAREDGEKLGLERGEKIGLERGEKLGLQRGLQRAEERAILIGRVEVCEHFLKQGPTPRETLRALSLEELGALADRLEKQATGGDSAG